MNNMFDYIQYGIIPYFLQVKILKMGLEHPTAKMIKKIQIPEHIWGREEMCFYDHFLMFHSFKWISSTNFVGYTN